MKGIVDDSGRAILPVKILCTKHPTGVQVYAWIDTGFTGDLVLPESLVEDLELEVTGSIDGVLADGSQVELSTYHCQLNWFGRVRDLEVIANSGQTPLLGVGLLPAKELRVDYTTATTSFSTTIDGNSHGISGASWTNQPNAEWQRLKLRR
jgi:clan AA aspartic protease